MTPRDTSPFCRCGQNGVDVVRAPTADSRLFAYLTENQLTPVGPPFWKYAVIDMAHTLHIEVGIPIADSSADDYVEPFGQFRTGVLPASTYATVTHIGHPD